MRVHVYGNAVDAGREVRAVIEIETAQKILIGLAVTAVLGHDESGDRLEQLARTQHRPRLELGARDRALRRRFHVTDELASLRGDDDFFEIVGGNAGGKSRRDAEAERQGAQARHCGHREPRKSDR
jgi:hypothetical protein